MYLRRFRQEDKSLNYLIDPGSPSDFPFISKKISSILGSVSKIHLYSLHSPDADVCMNAIYLRKTNSKAICITSEENWSQAIHYEIHPKSVKLINNFKEGQAPLATGHTLQFITVPFCSVKGSFMTYDPDTRVLFSGDLFSGLNTIQINMIPDGYSERLTEGITYVLKIQHVNIVSQYEFIPIKIGNN